MQSSPQERSLVRFKIQQLESLNYLSFYCIVLFIIPQNQVKQFLSLATSYAAIESISQQRVYFVLFRHKTIPKNLDEDIMVYFIRSSHLSAMINRSTDSTDHHVTARNGALLLLASQLCLQYTQIFDYPVGIWHQFLKCKLLVMIDVNYLLISPPASPFD